jgi:WD40 repeat protein
LLDANHYADLGPNHTVRIWDLTAEAAKSLYGHASRPEAVASGGPWIATASERERSVRLWDAATGEPRRIMADGIGGAATLVFSPDGGLLVSANYDTDIRVWRTGSGELIRKIEDQAGAMFAASFTPDGKHLVMGGLDENIYLYDAQNWRLARTLKGHGETIAALAISPDGRLLVTGGFDTTTTQNPVKVVFWDLAAGRILRSAAAPHAVVSLAFSPDSKWVAVTAREKEITLWKSPA